MTAREFLERAGFTENEKNLRLLGEYLGLGNFFTQFPDADIPAGKCDVAENFEALAEQADEPANFQEYMEEHGGEGKKLWVRWDEEYGGEKFWEAICFLYQNGMDLSDEYLEIPDGLEEILQALNDAAAKVEPGPNYAPTPLLFDYDQKDPRKD